MPYSPAIARELRRIVGNEHVIDNHNDLRIFERDGSIEGAMPEAIVLPSSSEQVADVMSVAAKHRIPIVPRGAGTGLSGGAVTINGGIALQMSRMRRIIEIDTVAQTAVVEPGVVNLELSVVAAQYGLFYAPDPASQKACTIGGNAAENSGGPHCLYYGVTTNHVLGMEVVLADGSLHWVSGDSPERVGLDLCGVLVGSEGTLCAITKIKVRLLRVPPSVATLLCAFPTVETASQAVSSVIGHGIVPAALEMMDDITVGAVEAHYHAGYPTDAGAVLLVEVDGIAESTRELMAAIRNILAENQGFAMREAQSPAERDLLWQGRKGAIGALGRIKPNTMG
jgi:glycolate oxidase